MAEKYREMGKAADGMRTGAEASKEAREIWDRIRSDTSHGLKWAWFTMEGTNYVCKASGNSSLDGFAAAGSEATDNVWFGAFRTANPGTKFIQVLLMPESVSPLKRGKAQLQKAGIFNSWPGANGEASVTSSDEDTLREAISKICGCKPSDLN